VVRTTIHLTLTASTEKYSSNTISSRHNACMSHRDSKIYDKKWDWGYTRQWFLLGCNWKKLRQSITLYIMHI